MKKILKNLIIVVGVLLLYTSVIAAPPPGVTTAPYTMTYTAKLNDTLGDPITTPHDIRFSIWTDADVDPTDFSGTLIDPGAAGFTSWEETYTVTPNVEGIFTVQLGSQMTLPNFTLAEDLYLQVEVRASGGGAFEVLDPDGIDNAEDRKPITSVPYTINADTVDNYDVGFGPFEIPILNGTGILDFSILPDGVNQETFVLDQDNSVETAATGSIVLQFGRTLGKILEYDLDMGYFNFNDSVNIEGDLTVNGAPVGPYAQSIVYEPVYADTVINGDGSDNRGKMEVFFVDNDGVPGNDNKNYYQWTTRNGLKQDMDLVLRFKIPEGFVAFDSVTPIEFEYRTLDANVANNQLDLEMEDTLGASVALTGASSLVSSSWTSAAIGFVGVPTITAGESITIKVKLSANSSGAAFAGKMKLNFVGS